MQAYITGAGVVTSSGVGVESLRQDLHKCETESPPTSYLVDNDCYPYASLPSAFNNYEPEVDADILDVCLNELMATSGLSKELIRSPDTALLLGLTIGPQFRWSNQEELNEQDFAINFETLPEHITLQVVAERWGITGMRFAVNAACASSAIAVGVACELLASGIVNRVLVGGCEHLNYFDILGFKSSKLLALNKCRPFDVNRNGIMLGEGGGLLLIEKKPSIINFARIRSWATTNDRYDMACPDPEGKGLANCISMAMIRGDLSPMEIDYVNAHGTGTLANDSSESHAFNGFWSNEISSVLVSSTKGLHGHLRGAAGVVELLISIIALQDNIAPITRGCVQVDPVCTWNCVTGKPIYRQIKVAMSVSRGFGGMNTAIIIEKPY